MTTDQNCVASNTKVASSTFSLPARIVKQVEFYFSDANLPRDKFLKAQIEASENGFVPISVLATFTRMRKLLSELEEEETNTSEYVSQVLRERSTLLEVSADSKGIRRAQPMSELQPALTRTIYIKGFLTKPIEKEQADKMTLDAIEECLDKILPDSLCTIQAIRMRRFRPFVKKDTKKTREIEDEEREEEKHDSDAFDAYFRGSVFVELASDAQVTRVIETYRTNPGDFKFGDLPLSIESKVDYLERKNMERNDRENKKGGKYAALEGEQKAFCKGKFMPGCIFVLDSVGEEEEEEQDGEREDADHVPIKEALVKTLQIAYFELCEASNKEKTKEGLEDDQQTVDSIESDKPTCPLSITLAFVDTKGRQGGAICRLKEPLAEKMIHYLNSMNEQKGFKVDELDTYFKARLPSKEEEQDYYGMLSRVVKQRVGHNSKRVKLGA